MLVLERLSAAVNKPEELERLIKESKELLKHTTPASEVMSSGASGTVLFPVAFSPRSTLHTFN